MAGKIAMNKDEHMKLTKKILRRKAREPIMGMFDDDVFACPKYNRLGEPINNKLWHILINADDYYKLAEEFVEGNYVKTSWIGMNILHNEDRPFIFDTEIINLKYNAVMSKYYYPSEDVAFKHHQKLVFMLDQKMFEIVE